MLYGAMAQTLYLLDRDLQQHHDMREACLDMLSKWLYRIYRFDKSEIPATNQHRPSIFPTRLLTTTKAPSDDQPTDQRSITAAYTHPHSVTAHFSNLRPRVLDGAPSIVSNPSLA